MVKLFYQCVHRTLTAIGTLCHRSNFGFFDHGEVYTALGLLATGGSQLSQRGNRILGHELAGLIERALN